LQSVFRAFERASEGTLIVDRDARIAWISEKHAKRFGVEDARQALGRHVEDVIPNSRMREVIASGQPILLDILDAPSKPVVVTRMPLKNEDGEVVGAVGFALFDEWATLAPLVSRKAAHCSSTRLATCRSRLGIGRATLYRKMAAYHLSRWVAPGRPRTRQGNAAAE
jgi:transcriptional regulator with PAS, ATPase and Fis domain